MSSLASRLSLVQLLPISQDFDFSDVASSTADEVGDAAKDVDGDCWLGALRDHDELVEWHRSIRNNINSINLYYLSCVHSKTMKV